MDQVELEAVSSSFRTPATHPQVCWRSGLESAGVGKGGGAEKGEGKGRLFSPGEH